MVPTQAHESMIEIASPHLQVVIDGANLFHAGQLPRMAEILDEAFDLLGGDIALAHAKDLERDGDAGHQAAGTGLLDYDRYLRLLDQHGFQGGLILHSLAEAQVPTSAAFVRAHLPIENEPHGPPFVVMHHVNDRLDEARVPHVL